MKKFIQITCLLFVAIIAFDSTSNAQNMGLNNTINAMQIATFSNEDNAQGGSIKGKITNKDGEGLQFVNITLKDSKYGTVSNEDGEYLLKNIKAGTYTLVVKFVGLKTQEKTIEVIDKSIYSADFQMVEATNELSEVTVSGVQSANERTVTIGKIAIKPMDLPQAVATIDRTVLERQQVLRLSDALMNANGIYIMGNTGGYQEEIAGRGFAFSSSNTFKNGARYFNGTMPEMSSVERVEIMKGSSAILFGNVAAGGILNLVTKKPKFESGGSLSMRLGSFDFYKPTLDLYGRILGSKKVAYRINGTYEKGNSFRENVNSERVYVNPSLLFKLSDKTEILLEGDYMKDRRTADFGTGAVNYEIADVPRERNIGVSWSYYDIAQKSANITITHQFNNAWKITATGAYRAFENDLFSNLRPNSTNFIATNGKWIRGLQRSQVEEKYLMGQVDLTGQFKTGNIGHNVLIGTDFDQYDTQTTAFVALTKYDSTNIYQPNLYVSRTDIPTLKVNTITTAPINRVGAYVQDLISFSDKLKFLAGLRYSYQETGSVVLTVSTNKMVETITYDGAFTPRFGLIYQPTKMMSIFGSYANSFNVNMGVDIAGNALPPSFLNQFEVGMKNELFNGLLSANITAYQIVNSNLAQTSLANGNTNTNIRELAGEVTAQGVEIDIKSKPFLGFSLMAGYSYNETRYTKSNIFIEGSLLRYNPNHTANASIYYTFSNTKLKGLNVGLTAMYFGERQAGRSTRLTVKNDVFKLIPVNTYTQIDASAGYNFTKFSIRAKISNLLNELSYNIHDDNSVNPIAPRMASVTVAYKW
jgi:iron complex outermembrane recepter protein